MGIAGIECCSAPDFENQEKENGLSIWKDDYNIFENID